MQVSLFDPVPLKTIELRNRFVLAAAASGTAADAQGIIRKEEISRLVVYAKNGVGLIITGAIGITDTARSHSSSCLLAHDRSIAGFFKLTESVHDAGGKIAAQLCHSGIWTGPFSKTLNRETLAPSRIPESAYTDRPGFVDNYHAATEEEIREVISAFGDAAARAQKAGFDAIEVHGAHDSLLAQFLSPLTNHRTDRWGGTLKNRVRIHCEVAREIRSRVGSEYPVILKIGAADGIATGPGLEFGDGRQAARLCAQNGFDILEISQGLQGPSFAEMALRSPIKSIDQEGFTRAWCKKIKQDTGVPTIMTGGLRSLELIEEVMRNIEADFIGLCRPLICEPELIVRWKNGDRKKSTCISCNKCGLAISKGLPLDCYMDKKID